MAPHAARPASLIAQPGLARLLADVGVAVVSVNDAHLHQRHAVGVAMMDAGDQGRAAAVFLHQVELPNGLVLSSGEDAAG